MGAIVSKRSYNVAHVMPWESVGGTERATMRIIRAVEGDNFSGTAFCLPKADAVKEFFGAEGVPIVAYDKIELSLRSPWRTLSESYALAREFKRRQIDIVHCADLAAGQTAALAGKFARVPVLCHVRNRNDRLNAYERRGLWAVSKFAFVSRDTWRRFGYQVSPERGTVLYDGIDMQQAVDERQMSAARREVNREFGLDEKTTLIGMVARVSPQKDYETLIRAAAEVRRFDPSVRFLIVGGHSDAEEHRQHFRLVREWMARHEVEENFIFTDFRTDVDRLLGAMDIFALSTHYEGLPLVILEAMARAKPVVATAVDGIPELVTHERTGLLFAHQNSEELVDQLASLMRDRGRAKELGRAGRNFAETHFSYERFGNQVRQLYRALLKSN